MAPNTHHCLFLIHHFVHIWSIIRKPWHAYSLYNCGKHQTTPLLLRMLSFMLEMAKELQPTSKSPVQTLMSYCLCTTTGKIDNQTLGAYNFSTHQKPITLWQECIFIQVHSKTYKYTLTNSRPDVSSTMAVSSQVLLYFLIGHCIRFNMVYHMYM